MRQHSVEAVADVEKCNHLAEAEQRLETGTVDDPLKRETNRREAGDAAVRLRRSVRGEAQSVGRTGWTVRDVGSAAHQKWELSSSIEPIRGR